MTRETILHDVKEIEERVILVGIDLDQPLEKNTMDTEACLDELEELAKTAGAVTVGRMTQKRERPHTSHYLGKGKVEELKVMIAACDATGIICDDELSPAQLKNLEQMLKTKIMDRTMLILDIFASHAVSREGKIQVELAQLKYRLSRLIGIGASMSRLGGGIGTRGPGEKKLEVDRRYIKERISELNKELKEIETHRTLLRNQRGKKGIPVVSMVGYTNAGKSTLMNCLTDAGVLAEDKLFATLDTTTRDVELPNSSHILLVDTVGFIQKLPHHLIQAFRATLEELHYSDILLHIVDCFNVKREEQMEVVYKTLKDLGCENTPIITVYNKIDKEIELPLPIDNKARNCIKISAKTKQGTQEMLLQIEQLLKEFRQPSKVLLPYTEGSLVSYIHTRCEILSEEHTGNGIKLQIYADDELKNRLKKYEIS